MEREEVHVAAESVGRERKVERKSDHKIRMENGRPNKEGAHISKHERERIGN